MLIIFKVIIHSNELIVKVTTSVKVRLQNQPKRNNNNYEGSFIKHCNKEICLLTISEV